MARSRPMDQLAAERVSTAAVRDPGSPTATSGFADRAREAASRNAAAAGDEEDDDEDACGPSARPVLA